MELTFCPFFFFFNDTATTEIYTLSLHDALPISHGLDARHPPAVDQDVAGRERGDGVTRQERYGAHLLLDQVLRVAPGDRSEEHTSELQSQSNLVCRLLLEKKKDPAPLPAARPAP